MDKIFNINYKKYLKEKKKIVHSLIQKKNINTKCFDKKKQKFKFKNM